MLFANLMQETPALPPTDFGGALLRMFTALFLVLCLLALSYWLLKKMIRYRLTRGVGAQAIQIIEKKMVSPKTMLYLVEVEGKKILFAESHLEVRSLPFHHTGDPTSDSE